MNVDINSTTELPKPELRCSTGRRQSKYQVEFANSADMPCTEPEPILSGLQSTRILHLCVYRLCS